MDGKGTLLMAAQPTVDTSDSGARFLDGTIDPCDQRILVSYTDKVIWND